MKKRLVNKIVKRLMAGEPLNWTTKQKKTAFLQQQWSFIRMARMALKRWTNA